MDDRGRGALAGIVISVGLLWQAGHTGGLVGVAIGGVLFALPVWFGVAAGHLIAVSFQAQLGLAGIAFVDAALFAVLFGTLATETADWRLLIPGTLVGATGLGVLAATRGSPPWHTAVVLTTGLLLVGYLCYRSVHFGFRGELG